MQNLYPAWKELVLKAEVPLPAMFVDLEAFDQNCKDVVALAKSSGKKLRPATKSIRVPWLMQRLAQIAGNELSGWMCFSIPEALYLLDLGLSPCMVAYPASSLREYNLLYERKTAGKKIPVITIDHLSHLQQIDQSRWAKGQEILEICLDVDMSWRPFPGLHLGVYRSSLRSVTSVMKMVALIKERPYLRLTGILSYEAQIAALGDKNIFHPLTNWAKTLIRKGAIKACARFRAQLGMNLKEAGVKLDFFNGGGTGSRFSTVKENVLTEFTVGSGFLQSHLFDYYCDKVLKPALFFALPVTRLPEPGVITVQSGGFIASGEIASEKAPTIHLPTGLKSFPLEGFGEVQTPLTGPDAETLSLGDPVFMRPCKAGEISEHFTHYHLVDQGRIIKSVPTYRGDGLRFF